MYLGTTSMRTLKEYLISAMGFNPSKKATPLQHIHHKIRYKRKRSHMKYFILLLSCVFIFSCNEDPCCVEPIYTNEGITSLAIGDQIRYQRFLGEKYFDNDNFDFEYTNDTVILEVVNMDGRSIMFKEYLTEGSSITTEDYYYADSVFYNTWTWSIDSLIITPTNIDQPYNLSHIATDHRMPYARFDQEIDIKGWKTNISYHESYREGHDPIHTIKGKTFENLNVIIDNTPMQVDGPGSTIIYNSKYGVIRSVSYSWWTQSGQGFDLLIE